MGISKHLNTKKLSMKTWYSSRYPVTSRSKCVDIVQKIPIPPNQNVLIFLVRNIYDANI